MESLDYIPQYGRCNLSRAVTTRSRLVARDLNHGGLVHEAVERRTLVSGVTYEGETKWGRCSGMKDHNKQRVFYLSFDFRLFHTARTNGQQLPQTVALFCSRYFSGSYW